MRNLPTTNDVSHDPQARTECPSSQRCRSIHPHLTTLIALVALTPLNVIGQPSGQSPHHGSRFQAKGAVIGSSEPSSSPFI